MISNRYINNNQIRFSLPNNCYQTLPGYRGNGRHLDLGRPGSEAVRNPVAPGGGYSRRARFGLLEYLYNPLSNPCKNKGVFRGL